ncbi:MAG: pyruvate formate lyase-activating protein [Clostridia bacterium]|nr:pyruvate formate lyase-activating protein [Clostridia bacterium]
MVGKVHSLETFGAVDGPGIRFVVFLQGCPLRCLYCHNPDTWRVDGGTAMSVAELMEQVKKYQNYFGSEGGVTVTGGEPLWQIDFVIEFFKALKKQKIHTCLDTSGILFQPSAERKFDKLLKYTDLVLLDIKQVNQEKHKFLTGQSNENVLAFAEYLHKKNVPTWIRFVLVPGVTDDLTDVRKLRDFIKTLKNVVRIEVLPYHTMGEKKYAELNLDYRLKGVKAPDAETITLVSQILRGEKQ